jgi:DNA adenine methylase
MVSKPTGIPDDLEIWPPEEAERLRNRGVWSELYYWAGKGSAKIAEPIVKAIEDLQVANHPYREPFCGGCGVTYRLKIQGKRHASDANEALITMYRALQQGWEPPSSLSEAEWAALKEIQDPSDPMTAFAGFGCSWGGKWFSGYAHVNSRGEDHTYYAARSLLKQRDGLADVHFEHADYRDYDPTGYLIWCDPAYEGTTTGWGPVPEIDHGEFWEIMLDWGTRNTVLVSEFNTPEHPRIKLHHSVKRKVRNRKKDKTVDDNLYLVTP